MRPSVHPPDLCRRDFLRNFAGCLLPSPPFLLTNICLPGSNLSAAFTELAPDKVARS